MQRHIFSTLFILVACFPVTSFSQSSEETEYAQILDLFRNQSQTITTTEETLMPGRCYTKRQPTLARNALLLIKEMAISLTGGPLFGSANFLSIATFSVARGDTGLTLSSNLNHSTGRPSLFDSLNEIEAEAVQRYIDVWLPREGAQLGSSWELDRTARMESGAMYQLKKSGDYILALGYEENLTVDDPFSVCYFFESSEY